jgi:hypothetical protein
MLIYRDLSGNGYGTGFVYRAKVEGELEAVGRGDSTVVQGTFNAALQGTFSATVLLVRSFDNGTSFQPLTALGQAIEFTAPCEEIFTESEPGVLYAWEVTSYTSGTIEYRISQ